MQILNQDILLSTKEEEWSNVFNYRHNVILRDRLMTDAALGGPRPIKSEHSYSLLAPSPPPSPATPGANPHTPNSGSGAVGSTTVTTSSSIDFANLDHKSLDIRDRIDGKKMALCETILVVLPKKVKITSSCGIPESFVIFFPSNLIPAGLYVYEKGIISETYCFRYGRGMLSGYFDKQHFEPRRIVVAVVVAADVVIYLECNPQEKRPST